MSEAHTDVVIVFKDISTVGVHFFFLWAVSAFDVMNCYPFVSFSNTVFKHTGSVTVMQFFVLSQKACLTFGTSSGFRAFFKDL